MKGAIPLLLMMNLKFILTDSASQSNSRRFAENEIDQSGFVVRFAGTIDSKSFFAVFTNSSQHLDWYEAADACKNMNMELAEIRSEAQSDLLVTFVISNQIDNTNYWVSGRDVRDITQFAWNSSNVPVSASNIPLFVPDGLPLSCLTYWPSYSGAFYTLQRCSLLIQRFLCEVPV